MCFEIYSREKIYYYIPLTENIGNLKRRPRDERWLKSANQQYSIWRMNTYHTIPSNELVFITVGMINDQNIVKKFSNQSPYEIKRKRSKVVHDTAMQIIYNNILYLPTSDLQKKYSHRPSTYIELVLSKIFF